MHFAEVLRFYDVNLLNCIPKIQCTQFTYDAIYNSFLAICMIFFKFNKQKVCI